MKTDAPLVAALDQHGDDAPILELRPVGDGRRFLRVLARSIVRRELIAAGLVEADRCVTERKAG